MLAAAPAVAQEVTYALPRTSITVEVVTRQQSFSAGKYAAYAKDLLGLDVLQKDTVITEITTLKIRPRVEADQSRRFTLILKDNQLPAYLELTKQGLISGKEGGFNDNGGLHFDKNAGAKTEDVRLLPHSKPASGPERKPVYEEQVVTRTDSLGNEYSEIALVEVEPVDSLRIEAEKVAGTILDLREYRYKILTGDTDANYAGEALGAAIAELSRQESKLLPLFEGTVSTSTARAQFEVIPDKAGTYPAFALDPCRGPVRPTRSGGCIFDLTVEPEPVGEGQPATVFPSKKHPSQHITYRIPAICLVTLTGPDGEVLSLRLPVYQLGLEATYPVYD